MTFKEVVTFLGYGEWAGIVAVVTVMLARLGYTLPATVFMLVVIVVAIWEHKREKRDRKMMDKINGR